MLSVWSGMVLLHHSPQLATSPDLLTKVMMMMMTILTIMMTVPQVPLIGGTPVNLTLLVTLIYVVSYVAMDPVAGSLAAGLVLLLHRWTAGGCQCLLTSAVTVTVFASSQTWCWPTPRCRATRCGRPCSPSTWSCG